MSVPLKLIRGRVQEFAVRAGEEAFIGVRARRAEGIVLHSVGPEEMIDAHWEGK